MPVGPYQKLYPEQESITFDGGLDNKFEKALLPDNESPDCLNVEFFNGSVATRQGATKLNTMPALCATTTSSPGYAFDGLYTRRDNSGAETMVAFIGGQMLYLNATTFITVPSAQSVFTAGFRVATEQAENYLFIGNGSVTYKYDGSLFTQHGVSAPTQTAICSSGTTGSLTTSGQYVYKYTYVNSALVESDLGPATATFVVSTAGLSIVVTNIASGSTYPSQGVARRYLYRTVSSGSAYYRVTKLNDVSTTSYTDTMSDTTLLGQIAAPTDNGVPPKYNAIIYHQNILFVNDPSNPNYVWYSTIGQPYTFPSTNFFKVGDRTSDLVKGFASYDNHIVIFCEQSTWINYMPDPATPSGWRQIRTNSPYGSSSPYCALKCNVWGNDVLLHPAVQNKKFVGFGALSGTTLDPSVSLQPITSTGSDLQSQAIEPDMFSVNQTYIGNVSGIVFKNRAFISLTYGGSATANNRIYVWDYSLSNLRKDQPASWAPWSGTPLNMAQMTIYGGYVYGASSGTTGFVYRFVDTGVYSDDGSAIDSYWWSKEFPGFVEDTALTKDFRYVNMLIDLAGSYFMNLRYKTDSDLGTGTSVQISLNPGGTLWGSTMIWGTATWGGGAAQDEKRIYLGPSIRGKRLQIRFDNQNTASQRFKVHRAQFMYTIKSYR